MKKKVKINVIKGIVCLGFVVYLASFLETNELLAVFRNTDWFYLLLSFLLIPVMLLFSCMKWKILIDVGKHNISFSKLLNIYLVGYFFSNLLPSTVGGDVVRSFYAGKEINDQSHAAVSVFVERFSSLLFLLILVVLAPLAQPSLYTSAYIFIPAICAFILLIIIAYAWSLKKAIFLQKSLFSILCSGVDRLRQNVRSKFFERCLTFVEHFLSTVFSRLERFSLDLAKALKVIQHDRVFFGKLVFVTVFFYILTWINVYVAFLTFGRDTHFLALIALVPTIMFVAHVPVSLLGNLGFFESVFVFYFLLIGIPGEETLAMALLLRLKILFLGGVGFWVYLMYQKVWGQPPVVRG